jgi:hypothetical protein
MASMFSKDEDEEGDPLLASDDSDDEEAKKRRDMDPEAAFKLLLDNVRSNSIKSFKQVSLRAISTGSKARGLNAIPETSLPALYEALSVNTSITHLQLRHTGLHSRVMTPTHDHDHAHQMIPEANGSLSVVI